MIENHNSERHPTTIAATDLVAIVTSPSTNTQLQLITYANFVAGISTGVIPPFTYADYNDSRITGAAQKTANLSDLSNLSTARTNLGFSAVQNIDITTYAGTTSTTILGTIASGSIPVSLITGLGNSATRNVGTTAGTVVDGADSRLVNAITLNRTPFSDTNVAPASTVRTLAQTGTMTAPRVVTMPLANTYQGGSTLTVVDENGSVSIANTLTCTASGSDLINGLATSVISTAFGVRVFESDGTSKWTYAVDQVGSNSVITSLNTEAMYNPTNPFYGAVGNGADDYIAIASCFADAIANGDSTVIIPTTLQVSKTIVIPSVGFKDPYVVSVNTATSTINFSQDPGGHNGDFIQLQGATPTGTAKGTMYYRNFPNSADRTKVILYDTRPNAIAGGATGKIIITSDVRTSGAITINTRTLTVAAELNDEIGTNVLISGASGALGAFYIIAGVGTLTLTLNTTSRNTVTATTNNVTYVCWVEGHSFDSGLKVVFSPGAYLKKHPTFTTVQGNSILQGAIGSDIDINPQGEGLSSQFVPNGVIATCAGTNQVTITQGATDWALPGVAFTLGGGSATYYVDSISASVITAWQTNNSPTWPNNTFKIGQGISSGIVGITATGSSGATSVVVNSPNGLFSPLPIYFAGDTNGPHVISSVSGSAPWVVNFSNTLSGNLSNNAVTSIGGDDGFDFSSVRHANIHDGSIRHCGDSALRVESNGAYYGAQTTSNPLGGVSNEQIVVERNDFFNCYQTSTTAQSTMVGGAKNIAFLNNTFEYHRGSVKFATRVPGARGIRIWGNTIISSDNHGLEIGSICDLDIMGNSISNVFNQGIFIVTDDAQTGVSGITAATTATNSSVVVTSNSTFKVGMTGNLSGLDGSGNYQTMKYTVTGVPDATHITASPTPSVSIATATVSILGFGVVGFPFDGLQIRNNILDNCGQISSSSFIRIAPDQYTDGYKFTYKNVSITGNVIRNSTNVLNVGINLVNGSYQGLNIDGNKFMDYQGATAIKHLARGEVASGFVNGVRIGHNEINMNNGSGFGIWVERTSGTQKLNDITFDNNFITGTCNRQYVLGDLNNVKIRNRTNAGLSSGGLLLFNSGTITNFTVDGEFYLIRTTTNATQASLLWDNGTSTAKPVLNDNQIMSFSALVSGQDAANNAGGYRVEGLIKRGVGVATTAIVGSVTTITIAEDTAGWDVTAVADTTNGALDIKVTGAAATTIRWVARVQFTEVI